MEQTLISIALCTYNGHQYLREQLDSLVSQSYQNIEIIAVDDCSTDLTFEILLEYAATNTNIKVYRNESRLGYNLNFGKALRHCTGQFIAISDQDDIWRHDKLEIQLNAIKDNMLVYCDSHFVDSSGKSMSRNMSDKFNFYKGSQPEVFLFSNCVSGHTIFMQRSILKLALPFPTQYHYDQWLAFIACCTGSIDYIDEALVQYRIHNSNCTDILALKQTKEKPKLSQIERLLRESRWLQICAAQNSASQQLIKALYHKSLKRNSSFFHLSFGILIWNHKTTLLYLIKKKDVSKFFFVLRKAWGFKAKQLF